MMGPLGGGLFPYSVRPGGGEGGGTPPVTPPVAPLGAGAGPVGTPGVPLGAGGPVGRGARGPPELGLNLE